jgi:hypothetical protein
METTKTPGSHALGIATRTTILLDHHRLVSLSMRRGELLRSARGTVWATIDGESKDIVLELSNVHRVSRDCTMLISAFGTASIEVYGHGPLQFEVPLKRTSRQAIRSALRALLSLLRPDAPTRRASLGLT